MAVKQKPVRAVRVRAKQPRTRETLRVRESSVGNEVLGMMKNLSDFLRNFREMENVKQQDLAERLDISLPKYSEIERHKNINPDFGCSLTILTAISRECRIELPELVSKIQGRPKNTSYREGLDRGVLDLLDLVPMRVKDELLEKTRDKPEFFAWLIELGLKLIAVPEKVRLEIDMQLERTIIEQTPLPDPEMEQRRTRILALMGQIIELEHASIKK